MSVTRNIPGRSAHEHRQPIGPPGAPLAVMSPRTSGRLAFGLVSLLLHLAAAGALAMLVTRPGDPTPPNEASVEMVFQQIEETTPVPEQVAEKEPDPPEPDPPLETPPPAPAPELPVPETPPPPPEPLPPEPLEPPEPAPPDPPPPPEPLAPPPPELPVPEPPPAPPPVPRLLPPKPKPPPPKPVPKQAVARPVPAMEASPRPAQPGGIAVRQAPMAAPPPIATPAAQAGPAVDPSWQADVFRWLSSRKTYPEEARRRGEQGRVAIRFTVDRAGRVMSAAVVGGSGSVLLDQATVVLLQHAPLPPFPRSMTQASITVTTSISYSLR